MFQASKQSNFQIEQILNDKIIQGKLLYFVKWKGYPHEQNTWEPQQHLKNVPDQISLWKEKKRKIKRVQKPSSRRRQDEEQFQGQNILKKTKKALPYQTNKQQLASGKSARADDLLQPSTLVGRQASKDEDTLSFKSETAQHRGKSKKEREKAGDPLTNIIAQIKKLSKKSHQSYQKQSSNDKKNRDRQKGLSKRSVSLRGDKKYQHRKKPTNQQMNKSNLQQIEYFRQEKKQQQPKKINSCQKEINSSLSQYQKNQVKKQKYIKKDKQFLRSSKTKKLSKVQASGKKHIHQTNIKLMNKNEESPNIRNQTQKNSQDQSNSKDNFLFSAIADYGFQKMKNKNNKKKSRSRQMGNTKQINRFLKNPQKKLYSHHHLSPKVQEKQKPQIYKQVIEYRRNVIDNKKKPQSQKPKNERRPGRFLEDSFQLYFNEERNGKLRHHTYDLNNQKPKKSTQEVNAQNKKIKQMNQSENNLENKFLSILGLSDSKQKQPKVIDELQQIMLTPSKRLPNFLDALGSMRIKNQANKQTNTNLPDRQTMSDRQKARWKQNVRQIDNKKQYIQIETSQNNSSQVASIDQSQFNYRIQQPRKKIFLNDKNSTSNRKLNSKSIFEMERTNHASQQSKQVRDPRLDFAVKMAAARLIKFIDDHPTKWWQKDPKVYIQQIKKSVRTEQKPNQDDEDDDWEFPFKQDTTILIKQDTLNKKKTTLSIKNDQEQKYKKTSQNKQKSTSNQVQKSTSNQKQQEQPDVLIGIEQQIKLLFQQRYPDQPISALIGQEIKRIVQKIAFEDLEIELGLQLIDKWIEAYQKNEIASLKMVQKQSMQKKRVQSCKNSQQNIKSYEQSATQTNKNTEITQKQLQEQGQMFIQPKSSIKKHHQAQVFHLDRTKQFVKSSTQDSLNQKIDKDEIEQKLHQIQKGCNPIGPRCIQQQTEVIGRKAQEQNAIKDGFFSYNHLKNSQSQIYKNNSRNNKAQNQNTKVFNALSSSYSNLALTVKPKTCIDPESIVQIVSQFRHKGQKCFKLLLANGKIVNAYFQDLKRNCSELLIYFFIQKSQAIERQNFQLKARLQSK